MKSHGNENTKESLQFCLADITPVQNILLHSIHVCLIDQHICTLGLREKSVFRKQKRLRWHYSNAVKAQGWKKWNLLFAVSLVIITQHRAQKTNSWQRPRHSETSKSKTVLSQNDASVSLFNFLCTIKYHTNIHQLYSRNTRHSSNTVQESATPTNENKHYPCKLSVMGKMGNVFRNIMWQNDVFCLCGVPYQVANILSLPRKLLTHSLRPKERIIQSISLC